MQQMSTNPYQNFVNQTTPQYYQNALNGYGQQQNTMVQQRPSQDIVQVNGIEGARAFQMPPNSRAMLLDSNDPIAYIKVTDGAGFGTLNAYNLTPIEQVAPKKEIDIEDRLRRLEFRVEELINEQSITADGNTNRSSSTDKPKRTNGSNATSNATTKADG